jgi:N-acyl-D-aspartate/D-glutamate deacylase
MFFDNLVCVVAMVRGRETCAQREVSDRASVNGSQIESSHLRTVCADGITTGICERFTDAREQGRVLLAASRAVYLELDSR